jgi:hypothetical protein
VANHLILESEQELGADLIVMGKRVLSGGTATG